MATAPPAANSATSTAISCARRRRVIPALPTGVVIGSLLQPLALSLHQLHNPVRCPAFECLPGSVRPAHLDYVHPRRWAESEVSPRVVAAQVALPRIDATDPMLT